MRRVSLVRLLPAVAAALVLAACASAQDAPAAADATTAASNATAPDVDPAAADLPAAGYSGRVLVVYFAAGKAARMAAADLTRIYGADSEAVVEAKPRRFDFFGYMGAGYQATFGIASPIAAPVRDPAAYDAVVVLTPVWSWSLSPPVRSYLRAMKGRLPAAVGFVTVSGGTEPDKIAAAMAKEGGVQPRAVVGFSEGDFDPAGRAVYLAKLGAFVAALR
jgi:hypothetical protein